MNVDIVSGPLYDRFTLVLRSVNNQVYPSQRKWLHELQCPRYQKCIIIPNIIDLRAELDIPAKLHFTGHISLARSHQVCLYAPAASLDAYD